MNCKPNNSCCSPTQQWKEILLNTQDKAIQAYNLAQQALDEIENLPAGGGSVQSVNGELPDQDGDVTVDTGVLTVNGVSPDADGEVTITAGSNITITPDADTNSIEISASVPSDWNLYNSTDWTNLFDANGKSKYNMIIAVYLYSAGITRQGFIYVPKQADFKYAGTQFVMPAIPFVESADREGSFLRLQPADYSNIMTATYLTLWFSKTDYTKTGSGADEVITLYSGITNHTSNLYYKMTTTSSGTYRIAVYTQELLTP